MLASALLVISVLTLAGCTEEEAGPLAIPAPHGWSYYVTPGDSFTDGLELLFLDATKVEEGTTAVLEDVALIGDPELRLVDALLAPPPREFASVQVLRSWPPRAPYAFDADTLVDFGGTEIAVGQGGGDDAWELFLRIKVEETASTVLRREGIRIEYRVGDTHYTATLPAELAICTAADQLRRGRCPS